MARATPMQASLNAGEIGPLMMGRLDQAVYSIAGEKMENFVPLIQGPMLKRSGLRHVAMAKGPCRLIDFEFNTTQSYAIEAGEDYLRFFTNNVQIMDGDAPYEVATPFSYADVLGLDMTASADVLYLVHGSHAPRTLSRVAAEEFVLAELALTGGPFDDDNSDEDVTVSASASSGDVHLYAFGADIFEEGHVGGLFRMEARDLADIPTWEPDISVGDGELRQWEGKVYQKVGGNSGRTGTVPPIHSSGVEWDGMGSGTRSDGTTAAGGVQWLYVHDRFGILRITGYVGPREVEATVLRRLPNSIAAANSYDAPIGYTPPYSENYSSGGRTYFRRFNIVEPTPGEFEYEPVAGDYTAELPAGTTDYEGPGTWRWAFGAFSEARGWPEKVFIWNERLVFTKGATLYASVVGAYTDFRERNDSGEITADMAFRNTLNSPNAIRWIMGDDQLLIGSAKKEHVGGALGGGVPGPGNFKAPAQTDFGSANVKPVSVGGRLLHVEKSGRRIMQLDVELARDGRFDGDDLTVMADHVTRGGVTWMARQASPHSLVWIGTATGDLAAMAYSPRQEVKGWCRCPLPEGSAVRWGCVTPDPEGKLDQLWLAVERGGQWLIGYIDPFWEAGSGAVEDGFFVDHGLSYDGAPADEFSGLDHLEGETVAILADGRRHRPLVVDGGAVTLDWEASKVHIGLPYRAYFKSLRIEGGSEDGTAQGKIKRISHLTPRLLDAAGLRLRVQGGDWEELDELAFGDVLEAHVPLFTGDRPTPIIGDYDREGQIELESEAPLPACILSLTPTIKVGSA